MSSGSSSSTNSSESPFILVVGKPLNISSKPTTTEATPVQLSDQDGLLKSQDNSSKAVPPSTISSLDCTNNQENGSLKSTKERFDSESSSTSVKPKRLKKNDVVSLDKEQPICRFYQRNGFCRYGRNCRFDHSVSCSPKSERRPYIVDWSSENVNDENLEEASIDQESADSIVDHKLDNESEDSKPKSKRVCQFYFRNGHCRFGTCCRYAHSVPQAFEQLSIDTEHPPQAAPLKEVTDETDFKRNIAVESTEDELNEDSKQKSRICRYFSRFGTCRFEVCKFIHQAPVNQLKVKTDVKCQPSENKLDNFEKSAAAEDNKYDLAHFKKDSPDEKEWRVCKRPVLLRNKKASQMTAGDLAKLRDTEISQLKKRYPKLVVSSNTASCAVFQLEFFASDPDWRFDVKSVNLLITIPGTYPKEILQLEILNPTGILPMKFIRYFNKSMVTWLQVQRDKNKADDKIELVLRPFLRWLDQSLEDLFISGLKMVKREIEAEAAGIEFVTHEELSQTIQHKNDTKSQAEEEQLETEYEESMPAFPDYEESMPSFMENANSAAMLVDQTVDERALQETAKRGTEIKLRSLELTEGAAGLTCRKLTVTVQCGRCKMRSDVAAAPHRNHRVVCERCHHQQRLSFRPQMLHQYSSIAGYLDLENCQVIDVPLLTCEFALQCLPCGRQNLLTTLHYGQHHSSWCMFCNSKMVVFVESIKLNQLQPSNITVESLGQLLKLEKKEKRIKDPAIQEGRPLPENGVCKHYKKSFRWLRFPCCGKAYPCDFCHNEKETEHEMKFATRMICGFCAKEQPYANERPCVLCSANMTKKSGAHWEGGKGCRDKIKMSKDDKQKYAGGSKTISRKATPAPKKK